MNHTPGPWHYDPDGEVWATRVNGQDVTICPEWLWARSLRDEGMANARLIAAAPELLEALQDLLEFLDPNECIGDEWALVARAKVAVDKALGRSTAPPASAEASGQVQLSPDP